MPVMLSRQASIDYDVQGEGPDLLLIGGLGFGRWFKQVLELSRYFRTISFDVRRISTRGTELLTWPRRHRRC